MYKSQLKNTLPLKVAVFVFFLTLYLVTTPTDMFTSDGQRMFWVCQSLVEDGDVNISNQSFKWLKEFFSTPPEAQFISTASQYPFVPSLVGIPFYVMGKWGYRILSRPMNDEDLFVAVSFSSPVIAALTCLLLFQFILAMGFSPRAAFLSTCCYGLGTIAWFNSHPFGTEPITTLAILGAVYSAYLYKTKGRYFWLYLSGFLSGVTVSSREISILIVPPLLVYLFAVVWKKAKDAPLKSKLMGGLGRLFIFLLGLLPFLVLNVWYNFARYGLLDNVGYVGYGGKVSKLFQTPLFEGLYGLLVSPGKSLFLYCPVLVLAFFSIRSFYSKHKAEFILFLSIFLLHLLVYAKFGFWEGGTTFGPRYLAPTLPLLVLPMASFMETLPVRSLLTKIFVLLIFCVAVVIQTAPLWGYPSSEWENIVAVGDELIYTKKFALGEFIAEYAPQAFPILWIRREGKEIINQLFFFPQGHIRYFRFSIFLVLLSMTVVSGVYLVRKVHLVPRSNDLRSFAARISVRTRAMARTFLTYKTAASVGTLCLIVFALISYAFFKYAWVPLSRFNLKPFGTMEHPLGHFYNWIPTLNGEMEVRGWALDRSGIRAVEVYIDDVKAADAQYGEPSPEVHEIYPYIPNSDHARFIAWIDTSDFSNSTHVLLVRAFNQKGLWRDLMSQIVIFINEKPYDFWAHLGEAQPSDDNAVEDTMLSINRESRRVLLQRSNSTVTFEKIPVYDDAFLKLGIGIADESGPRDGAGLVLEITANSGELLFAKSINLQTYTEDPKWYDERIDLRRFRNQVISLTLKTQSGDDNTPGRIGWSDLKIVY